MKLRDLFKSNSINDGTRLLFESILVPEVAKAFKDWNNATVGVKCVLIGGVALSYYVKPRTTTDADLLFMFKDDIPLSIAGFKRTRQGAFQHNNTHVEIEVLTPESVNIPQPIAQAIYDNAKMIAGIRVAERAGLIVSKLGRFKLIDQADIEALLEIGSVDLTPHKIPTEWQNRFDKLVASL